MILGVHCSIRKGYLPALEEARTLGCGAMQMFSYRRHHGPTSEELEAFCRARAASSVRRLLILVRYVPFLASSNEERRRHSVKLLTREIRLARQLGGDGMILHAGAYSIGDDAHQGIERFAEGTAEAWAQSGGGIGLILENVPGGGRRMGGSLEELAEMGELLGQRSISIGFCLDTAHAWAQGYDIASMEGMRRFLGQANRTLGAAAIRTFHLNDTQALLGSHREHHWHWGKGHLRAEGLRFLLDRDEYQDAAGILETPKDAERENFEFVSACNGSGVRGEGSGYSG